ncbi:MAG: hypothetical protein QOG72_357 [Sphingomonadales bacterium]|jgi:hypothetical protein|nr:hypothetical protein [Sphingomonadales bacterium]
MAPYYLDVDGGARYNYGTFRDETGSLLLLDSGACQHVPHVISEDEADLLARNREIARLPFSWVT